MFGHLLSLIGHNLAAFALLRVIVLPSAVGFVLTSLACAGGRHRILELLARHTVALAWPLYALYLVGVLAGLFTHLDGPAPAFQVFGAAFMLGASLRITRDFGGPLGMYQLLRHPRKKS